ncbi:MAG: hypothetical protein P4M11_14205, partial [Candidatus Pacebacteria bacterium]|nr:hypothetical protein [Candidatus Paceibacterota bacterium]
ISSRICPQGNTAEDTFVFSLSLIINIIAWKDNPRWTRRRRQPRRNSGLSTHSSFDVSPIG